MPNIIVTASTHPTQKDLTLLTVQGYIDTNTAPEFERVFQTVLGERRFNLIIDLRQVDYISSAGWGIFVGEMKRIRSQKGNLFLACMSPEVLETYELLEFDSIIKAFPTVEETVVKGFKRDPGKAAVASAAPKRNAKKPASAEAPPQESQAPSTAPTPTYSQPVVRPKTPWPFRLLMPWQWF